jgi:multidrug resistance efflux pump
MNINTRAHALLWLGRAPSLRVDVRFAPQSDQFVRLYDPKSQRYVQLYPLECHLAQIMNGHRGLDELTTIAQQFNSEITRDMVERLVINLNAAGLLSAPAGPRTAATGEPQTLLKWQTDQDGPFQREPILESSLDADWLGAATELRVVPSEIPAIEAFDFDADAATVLVSEIPGIETTPPPDAFAETALRPVEIPEAAPDEAAPDAEAPPADDAEAAPVEEQPIPTAEEMAAQEHEQEQLLNQERKRAWYQRRSVRFLAIVTVLTVIAAIIPYPLRITSDCTIFPTERIKVRSEIQGVLTEILVDEGQSVKKGDVIARIDDRALKSERMKALAEIEKFEAELSNLQKGRRPEEIQQQAAVLAARRTEAAFASKQAQRRNQMAREGIGSKQQAEDASRELQTKVRAVAEADAAMRLLKAGSRPEEIEAHVAVVKRARVELAYIDQKIAQTIIHSPIDGEILTPRFREHLNEAVEAGGLVCDIANMHRMRAEIYIPQRFVDVIAIGMPAIVKVESYPGRPFEGKVDFIAPAADEGEGRRVRVVVELDNKEGLLKSNMAGYGEVEAGDRSLLDLATRRITRWIRVRFLL